VTAQAQAASVREAMLAAHRAAIDAVGGRAAVARHLERLPAGEWPTHAAAVGKAAADMMAGALDTVGGSLREALVITKHGHADGLAEHAARARVHECSHPVPDASCLRAGAALWDFVADAPRDARFLVMVSGGASALMEHLADGLDAGFLARVNDWLLASGLAIGPMNRVRKRLSRIKGGRLALALDGRAALCLMISDVPGDDPKVIGSGPLVEHAASDIDVSDLTLPDWLAEACAHPPPLAPAGAFERVRAEVVAHPALAREAATAALRGQGLVVRAHDALLEGGAAETGAHVVHVAAAAPGAVHVWSSETTVQLPPAPGRGGRCQSLALAAALAMEPHAAGVVLAAGTDGTDGPGKDAGAVVDAGTTARGRAAGRDALGDLEAADAGGFLAASGDLLRTGPTGTNVMDLLMAWCPGGP
jgi:hydroxypyruvate reductase